MFLLAMSSINVSLVGRHGQMEEPEQNSPFNNCISVLAMGFLAYVSLHSGSQSLVPGVRAFHMFCKWMRADFCQFFCTCVCNFLVSTKIPFCHSTRKSVKCVSDK